ncbi:MAG: menaquinone-specific isochorismate synthase [Natronomonas sp.]|jgi:menaquinone-specific isochorismate synthase
MKRPRGDERVGSQAVDGVVRWCRVEGSPVKPLLRAVGRPRVAWADATTTVVAGGAAATVTADGLDRFEHVRERAEAVFAGLTVPVDLPTAARPRLYGGFAFHEGHTDPGPGATWHGYPGALFVLPAVQLSLADGHGWLTAAATGPDAGGRAEARLERWRDRLVAMPDHSPAGPPGVADSQPTPSLEGWHRQVTDATASVRRGDLRKVVLAQSLTAGLAGDLDVVDTLDRLSDTYPGCFRFLVEPGRGGSFFGATPERLVSLEGRTVQTEALAGSTGRGETPAEDQWLASELQDSEKDVHEHELVADAVRDQLAPLAASIRTGTRTVRQLETVQHLRTPIQATLNRDEHVLSLVEALHPTPAVGGLPPDAALRTIRETEGFNRGWYAAPVGWFDAAGDGAFGVAIRSALARGDTATLFAGAGIVADSDPDSEWDELQLKYRPVMDELE